MTEDDLTFLPLRVTRVGVGGKRSFDQLGKQQLVDVCLQPGASLSGLALKAGANANQLRKWVQLREQSNAPVKDGMVVTSSAFVPVVAIDEPAPASVQARALWPAPEPERSPLSPRAAPAARCWLSCPTA
jgi:transposase